MTQRERAAAKMERLADKMRAAKGRETTRIAQLEHQNKELRNEMAKLHVQCREFAKENRQLKGELATCQALRALRVPEVEFRGEVR